MPKQEKENEKKNKTVDRIIQIILIIIIILLLLKNCSLMKNAGNDDNGKVNIIDINCNSDKCQQESNMIDCLQDENNSKCVVPNFVGKDKRDVLRWLDLISNTIEVEIKVVEKPNTKDGTVLEQSVVGTSVKDLIASKTKLVITIVNNGSLVDCEKNSQSSKCTLPDFVGKGEEEVEKWLGSITNPIKVKYVYVNSNKKAGTVTVQSVKSGTSIKDMLDNNQTLIIHISKGDRTNPSTSGGSTTPDEPTTPTEPDEDGEFYVNDDDIVKWQNNTDLKIFRDSANISKVNGKIAPESKGTYKFIVNNETKYNLKYKITFIEENAYYMNIRYKLKKGDTYLIDHYVAYNELNLEDVVLNSKDSDDYYLEWKWIGDNDENDTSIGHTASSTDVEYSLKITVEAESI